MPVPEPWSGRHAIAADGRYLVARKPRKEAASLEGLPPDVATYIRNAARSTGRRKYLREFWEWTQNERAGCPQPRGVNLHMTFPACQGA